MWEWVGTENTQTHSSHKKTNLPLLCDCGFTRGITAAWSDEKHNNRFSRASRNTFSSASFDFQHLQQVKPTYSVFRPAVCLLWLNWHNVTFTTWCGLVWKSETKHINKSREFREASLQSQDDWITRNKDRIWNRTEIQHLKAFSVWWTASLIAVFRPDMKPNQGRKQTAVWLNHVGVKTSVTNL